MLQLIEQPRIVELVHPNPRLMASQAQRAEHSGKTRQLSVSTSRRLLDSTLAYLRNADPERYRERIEEIAYLANVLIAVPQSHGERLRPVEALESALQITNRGLDLLLASARGRLPEEQLQAAVTALSDTTADLLFRRGYEQPGTLLRRGR